MASPSESRIHSQEIEHQLGEPLSSSFEIPHIHKVQEIQISSVPWQRVLETFPGKNELCFSRRPTSGLMFSKTAKESNHRRAQRRSMYHEDIDVEKYQTIRSSCSLCAPLQSSCSEREFNICGGPSRARRQIHSSSAKAVNI